MRFYQLFLSSSQMTAPNGKEHLSSIEQENYVKIKKNIIGFNLP
jgi:hypothetical protein